MGDTPRVLVVDDEEAIADGHAARLSDRYETAAAYDGESALELVDEDVDVVVLDRRMPGMGGEAVLERIREAGYDCHVVMLTGVEPDADAVDMAFDEYLVKPAGGDQLAETIEAVRAGDDDDWAEVLEALGNPKARRCCRILAEEPRGASDLAEETGYSLTTVYRRLNVLQQAGLIESRTEIEPDGDHYDVYAVVPTRVEVELDGDLGVERESLDRQAA